MKTKRLHRPAAVRKLVPASREKRFPFSVRAQMGDAGPIHEVGDRPDLARASKLAQAHFRKHCQLVTVWVWELKTGKTLLQLNPAKESGR